MATEYPLGRVEEFDPRSLNFLVEAPMKVTPKSKSWTRYVPIFNQGQVGSCTGNATAGLLGTAPLYGALAAKRAAGLVINEALAVKLYSRATVLDPYPGTYPPTDTGSSSLAVSKAAQGFGYIKSYSWITGLDAAYTAIMTSPFMVGVPWYQGMFTPDYNGVVHITGKKVGGHEFEIVGYSTYYGGHWKAANSWGASWGKSGYFYLDNPTLARLLSEQGDATVLTI